MIAVSIGLLTAPTSLLRIADMSANIKSKARASCPLLIEVIVLLFE